MNAEEKQALADWCEWRIARGSQSTMSEQTLIAAKIALAALTAQPVKLPDCDFAAVSHMSGGAEDYCYGFVDGTQNAIKAIRAAGYEVQE